MQESTQNAPESLCGTRCDHLSEMPEGEHQKTGRKAREREEIRLSENPSHLLSKEGFAMYIGKTVDAIVSMAKAGKLPESPCRCFRCDGGLQRRGRTYCTRSSVR